MINLIFYLKQVHSRMAKVPGTFSLHLKGHHTDNTKDPADPNAVIADDSNLAQPETRQGGQEDA